MHSKGLVGTLLVIVCIFGGVIMFLGNLEHGGFQGPTRPHTAWGSSLSPTWTPKEGSLRAWGHCPVCLVCLIDLAHVVPHPEALAETPCGRTFIHSL